MIGDNLETDVLFGINSNIATLLVMTGTSCAKAFPSIDRFRHKFAHGMLTLYAMSCFA